MNKKCKLRVYGSCDFFWCVLSGKRFTVMLGPSTASWKTAAGARKYAERVVEELGLTITKVEMPEE